MARTPKEQSKTPDPTETDFADHLFKLLLSIGVLFLIGYFFSRGGNFETTPPEPVPLVDARTGSDTRNKLCGQTNPSGRPIPIQMVYSEDKRPWIEYAAGQFSQRCPNIQVKLTAMEDFTAISELLDGSLSPTIWAPTDELSLRLLQHRAQMSGKTTDWRFEVQHELVQSPQVLLMWQDRLDLLSHVLREQPSDEGTWVRSICAGIPRDPVVSGLSPEQMTPGTWLDLYSSLLPPPVAETSRKPRVVARGVRPLSEDRLPLLDEVTKWGQVKIGHAMPTRFVAGLSALYLLSYDYVLKPSDRDSMTQLDGQLPARSQKDLAIQSHLAQAYATGFVAQRDILHRWLRRCEAGLDSDPRSVETLTESLFEAGPSRYDAILTQEQLTMRFLDKLDATAGSLKKLVVVYPKPTLIARHPAVRFPASTEQSEAADRWLGFLLSIEMQHKAIELGFRPGAPGVSIRDYVVEQNRFLRLRRFGILPQPVLHEAPRPDGRRLWELMELWGEATGRN